MESKIGSSGLWSVGQITLNGEGVVTSIRAVDNTDYFRELINKVIDEREEIKRLQEEVDTLNTRITMKSITCNPNKYKVNNGASNK